MWGKKSKFGQNPHDIKKFRAVLGKILSKNIFQKVIVNWNPRKKL